MDLVIDIGNFQVKAGFFDGDTLIERIAFQETAIELLNAKMKEHRVERTLVASVQRAKESQILAFLSAQKIPFKKLSDLPLKLKLDVNEPKELGQDRIANACGALKIFPLNDAIIVDLGTAVTFDLVAKEGHYLGGMIFPGFFLLAKSCSDYTDLLPNVQVEKPNSPVGKTTVEHLQSGIYYGTLGAVERLIDELRRTLDAPSSVKILATGGGVRVEGDPVKRAFVEDMKEFVDVIDPNLTLIGLHEILKDG